MIANVTHDTLSLRFERPWSLEDYQHFIRSKQLPEMVLDYRWQDDSYTVTAPSRFAHLLGLARPAAAVTPPPLATHLFDYQNWITGMALDARRFCLWADCGLGKSPMELEFGRQARLRAGGKVLLFAPRMVIPQLQGEAEKFYNGDLPLIRLNTRADMIRWCADKSDTAGWFAITNYEKMIPQEDSPQQVVNELRFLTAVIADESSILKTKGGTIKWALMKSTYGVPYKLSCTATPAPNDQLEYLSQAGFLDKFNDNTGDGPALASFFKLEADGSCKLKPHARSAFFNFMVAWSIYLRKPSAFGFRDPFAEVPEPAIEEIKVAATVEQESEAAQYLRSRDPRYLFASEKLGVTQRGKLSQIAKGFIYGGKAPRRIASRKPGVVAELTRQACREGRQVLVWTVFDEESEIIMEQLRDEQVVALHGKQSEDEREKILAAFVRGEITGLVSKAALLGYGLNFPFCTRMIFSGFDDSFERFYQAVRRCYRYGSREQLRVMVPYVPGLENHVWENVLRKKGQWEADTAECEQAYAAAMRRGLISNL